MFNLFDKDILSNVLCNDLKELLKEHIDNCENCKNGIKHLTEQIPLLKSLIGEVTNEQNKIKTD